MLNLATGYLLRIAHCHDTHLDEQVACGMYSIMRLAKLGLFRGYS